MLFGYFQSYKYFDEYYSTIIKLMRIDKQKQETMELYHSKYFLHTNNEICSMHFRIGDYKNIQDCHPVMPIEYFDKALQELMETEI